MIVDTSALTAVFYEEPEADSFARIILGADTSRLSVVSRLEFAIAVDQRRSPEVARKAEVFLRELHLVEEPVTLEQGFLARNAFYDYGRGRHPAKLNFGDCFAYALAKAYNEPLLFKGTDFAKTDVRRAR